MAGGVAGATLIVGVSLALRLAVIESVPGGQRAWLGVPVLAIVLLFGAAGEELLFHGYGFQQLVRAAGDFAAVLPVGIVFGLAHLGNQGVTGLAIVNTMAWGVLLGCAYLRTRALWLPIGLHFGWNVAMPLLGVNLSGFTMGVTGYTLRWRTADLWSGGAYGLEGGVGTTLVVAALFFLLSIGITLMSNYQHSQSLNVKGLKVAPLNLQELSKGAPATAGAPPSSSEAAPPLPTAAPPLPTAATPAMPTQAPRPTVRRTAQTGSTGLSLPPLLSGRAAPPLQAPRPTVNLAPESAAQPAKTQ